MADPARRFEEIKPDIQPDFRVIEGGGESTPERASLEVIKDLESRPEKPAAGSVAEQEANGSNVIQGPWVNNTTEAVASLAGPSGFKGFIRYVGKKSPTLAIALTVIGILFGVGGFIGTSLLPESIMANLVGKFNTGETSLSIRTNSIIRSMTMASDATAGSCNTIKFLCRFKRPSNRFITQLNKYGIEAIDGAGNVITKKGLFSSRPKTYRYTNTAGYDINIEADELARALNTDAELGNSWHKAAMTRFVSLSDSIIDKIKARFGFHVSDTLKTTNEKKLAGDVDGYVEIDDGGVKAAASAGTDAIEDAGREIITDEAIATTDKVAKAGKGDLVGFVSGAICAVTDVPGLIVKAERAFQMRQVIKYAMVIIPTLGAIKASDASPEEAAAVLGLLTTTMAGKSAMDSFGMNYVMTGTTKPQSTNYKKFSPGGNMISKLSGVTSITNSAAKKGACKVMTDPATGEVINVTLAVNAGETLGASLVAAAINIAAGIVVSEIAVTILPPILKQVIKLLPMEGILTAFFGDLTKGLTGEPVGDALASGAGHMMGQAANAGGNMPLTVPQAVAYAETTKQVQLAYAQEDRATLSPFDTSSPNTMMGSIVQKLMPFYTSSISSVSSVAGAFKFMGSVVMGSFGAALQPLAVNAESADPSQYQLCEDPDLEGIAAGPYCNIIYGVPPEYMGESPVDVITSLSGSIDEDSGEPIEGSDLATWIEMCTDGKSDQAVNCQITDKKTAEYALFVIDSRVKKAMDEGLPVSGSTGSTGGATGGGSSTGGTGAGSTLTGKETKVELAKMIIASKNVTDRTHQIKQVANGTRTDITKELLQLIADLSKNNTFTISSLVRPGSGSLHNVGKAADISATGKINGAAYGYSGHNKTVQKFVDEAAGLMGSGCEIGLPNSQYVNSTKSKCSVFVDNYATTGASGPHVHLGVGK